MWNEGCDPKGRAYVVFEKKVTWGGYELNKKKGTEGYRKM